MKLGIYVAVSIFCSSFLLTSCKKPSSEANTEQIESAIDKGDYESALALLNESIENHSDDAKLISLRGTVYWELGQMQEAQKDLDKALELSPENNNYALNLAAFHITNDKFETAIPILNQIITSDSDDLDAYRNRALANLRLKHYEDAIRDYTVALSLYDEVDPVLYEERAECWNGLGNTEAASVDTAIAEVTYKLEENPNDMQLLEQRGLDLYNLGEFYLALLDLDQVTEAGSESDLVYQAQGNAFLVLGEKEAALEALNQAIRINSNNSIAYSSRANAYEALAEWENATKDYEESLKLDPNNELALTEYAWLLATSPNEDILDSKKSFTLAKAAVKQTEEKEWRPFAALAAAHAALGNFKNAATQQKKAISLASTEDQELLENDLKTIQAGKRLTWGYPEED